MDAQVEIMGRLFRVTDDDGYLAGVGSRFEPDTVALLAMFCDQHSEMLDVGANIGMTALALSRICSQRKVVALEPMKGRSPTSKRTSRRRKSPM